MKPSVLHTPRLTLRCAEKGDEESLFMHYCSHKQSSLYLTRQPHQNLEQTRLFLKTWCETPWKTDCNQFAWVISLKSTNQAIGLFLVEIEEHKAQIHYGISSIFQNQGFVTEAGKKIITWLKNQPTLQRIWAVCDIENDASIKILEKLGFQREGILYRWLKLPAFNHQARDCYCYVI